jgi:hypothetical protein
MLAKLRWYNIMVLHIKRMTAAKRGTCKKLVSNITYDKPLKRDEEQEPIIDVA